MRIVTLNGFPIEARPDLGLDVCAYLAPPDWPPLLEMQDGETLLLRESNGDEHEAIAHLVLVYGRPLWYGVLVKSGESRIIESSTGMG